MLLLFSHPHLKYWEPQYSISEHYPPYRRLMYYCFQLLLYASKSNKCTLGPRVPERAQVCSLSLAPISTVHTTTCWLTMPAKPLGVPTLTGCTTLNSSEKKGESILVFLALSFCKMGSELMVARATGRGSGAHKVSEYSCSVWLVLLVMLESIVFIDAHWVSGKPVKTFERRARYLPHANPLYHVRRMTWLLNTSSVWENSSGWTMLEYTWRVPCRFEPWGPSKSPTLDFGHVIWPWRAKIYIDRAVKYVVFFQLLFENFQLLNLQPFLWYLWAIRAHPAYLPLDKYFYLMQHKPWVTDKLESLVLPRAIKAQLTDFKFAL